MMQLGKNLSLTFDQLNAGVDPLGHPTGGVVSKILNKSSVKVIESNLSPACEEGRCAGVRRQSEDA
jgi:hypothetical protein